MFLDGFQVLVGNSVYDLLLQQTGIVTQVGGGTWKADFGAGRVLTYSGNGQVAGAKRAYWRNPILTTPRKNDAQWDQLQAVVNAIRAFPCA